MTITPRENVPCVSQTKHWKGVFEEHFLTKKQINEKYPILNPLWKFDSNHGFTRINNRHYEICYRAKFNDFHQINQPYSDPWYRELKYDDPISDSSSEQTYVTTVETNAVLLILQKTKI